MFMSLKVGPITQKNRVLFGDKHVLFWAPNLDYPGSQWLFTITELILLYLHLLIELEDGGEIKR